MRKLEKYFFNNVDYILDEKNKKIKLLPDFLEKLKNKKLWNKFGFKKVGGSLIGEVLEVDQFKSQFKAFCHIAWINLPILNLKYVNAGKIIEPKVIQVIEQKINKKIQTFDAKKYNYDYFSEKDNIIGGLPDGYIEDQKIILEIKTTGAKNLESWNKYGVPKGYCKQAQLYSYLMNVDKYSIVTTFLKEEDYAHPENFPIQKRKIKNWNFSLNLAEVEDDIAKIKKWYQTYTTQGISPKYDENKIDQNLLAWLRCSNSQEWEKLKNKWIDEKILII